MTELTYEEMTCKEFMNLGQYPSHYDTAMAVDDLNEEIAVIWDGTHIYDYNAQIMKQGLNTVFHHHRPLGGPVKDSRMNMNNDAINLIMERRTQALKWESSNRDQFYELANKAIEELKKSPNDFKRDLIVSFVLTQYEELKP